jgi:hypothetical protein
MCGRAGKVLIITDDTLCLPDHPDAVGDDEGAPGNAGSRRYPKRTADCPCVSTRQNNPWPCWASADTEHPSATASNEMNERRSTCIETLTCCDVLGSCHAADTLAGGILRRTVKAAKHGNNYLDAQHEQNEHPEDR